MARLAAAALSYFGLAFGAGFLLGTFRVVWMLPRMEERTAELLEMPFMLAVTVLAARWIVRQFQLASFSSRAAVGIAALGLLVLAEVFVVLAIRGETVPDYLSSRNPVSGTVYAAMLMIFAAMPCLVTMAKPSRAVGLWRQQ